MPWRSTRDSYRIWLSEVMLQQTRVAAVVGYYRRFLRRFPTVQALARASEHEVLKHWAGLGYYSRARNLHRAAKQIVQQHNGRFPRTIEAALKLPGVGRYTAAAVLSIAYRQPHAVLDGNVARVLARLDAIRGDLCQPRRWSELQARADTLLIGVTPISISGPETARSKLRATRRRQAAALRGRAVRDTEHAQARSLCCDPGDWNQAMMELGATVCTPRAPRCDACPLARWCRARKLGLVEKIPAARHKPAPVRIELAAAVLLDRHGRTLLVKPEHAATNGLFSHMWQFPAVEGTRNPRAELLALIPKTGRGRSSAWPAGGSEDPPLHALVAPRGGGKRRPYEVVALKPARHTVTFREITLKPFLLRVETLPRGTGARTPRLDKLDSLAVSSATRKIAQRALEHLALQEEEGA